MSPDPKISIDWPQLAQDIKSLAQIIRDDNSHSFTRLLLIARGGLPIGGALSYALNIKDISIIIVESYHDKTRHHTKLIHDPQIKDGSDLLIIDDLSDTGGTLGRVKQIYPLAKTAALYTKPDGHEQADFSVRQYRQEQWIIFPWDCV